jgi:hypothetical protein
MADDLFNLVVEQLGAKFKDSRKGKDCKELDMVFGFDTEAATVATFLRTWTEAPNVDDRSTRPRFTNAATKHRFRRGSESGNRVW